MRIACEEQPGCRQYRLYKEQTPIGLAALAGSQITELWVEPAWRRRGYGSYLLKELLRQNGGYTRGAESCFTVEAPAGAEGTAGRALAEKFGFLPMRGSLCRRVVPDLTAVEFVHRNLQAWLPAGGFYLDATCGNGHDTLFLARMAGPAGRVLGLDIQPAAVAATNALLAANGFSATARAVQADHAHLAHYAPPGSADGVIFNFGWLPGADHAVHSATETTLAALAAGLDALKPGGVLAAVLYSGRVIGHSEKDAALAYFRALPLARYTVLVCSFANWAETAPLPCFVINRAGGGILPP